METFPIVVVALTIAAVALALAHRRFGDLLPPWTWRVFVASVVLVLIAYAVLWTMTP